MKRFITSLAIFAASFPLGSDKAQSLDEKYDPLKSSDPIDPINLRPLNLPGDNLFAAHRSHSSHASHRSSSGGGGYSTPRPAYQPAPQPAMRPVDPGRPESVSSQPPTQSSPSLTTEEKKRLQIMRVQIGLHSLGLYTGNVDGVLGNDTKEAIKSFQVLKDIKADGLMSTETLNALGVPAVQ